MIDLNTAIKSSTFLLEIATGINDQGQIVGEGLVKSNAKTHAFLLSPSSTTPALAQPASSLQPLMPSSSPGGGQSALTLGPLMEISTLDPLPTAPPGFSGTNFAAEPYVAVNPSNAPSPSMTEADSSPPVASTQPSSDAAAMPVPRQVNPVDVLGQLFTELDAGLSLNG
jgi:probable HAF family extracellular repeat protein